MVYVHAMRRRDFLRTTGLAASGGALAGCPGRSPETGLLVTRLGDQTGPLDRFESCTLTIPELRVLSAADATETEDHQGAELLFSIDGASVDLVELAGGGTTLAFEQELMTGRYAYLKLAVGRIDAMLVDGRDVIVETPDDGPLKVALPFEVSADEPTVVTAGLGLAERGAETSYELRLVPSLTSVSTR